MNLSEISIKRPVLSMVFAIIIIILGVSAYFNLGVREFPSIEKPVINVFTSWSGANANVIEAQITEPLEEAINSVAGIKSLSSVSTDGRSSITIEFDPSIDLNDAANDVREKVSRSAWRLPPDSDPPGVVKADPDAGSIFTITMQSDKRSLQELSQIGENTLKERFQTIPGVSSVYIMGEKRYAMRIRFNAQKMNALKVTPIDVQAALQKQNIELPSGRVEGDQTEYTLRTIGQLTNQSDFEEVIIRQEGSKAIKLRDIATIKLGTEYERNIFRGNGVIPMIGVAVQAQPGANYIEIVDEAYRRLAIAEKELPEDIVTNWSIDQTVTIRKAIQEVKETILIAFVLVLIVIFFFLRNWRSTLIPIILIPISLMGSFIFLYVMGFSINVLTLLGLVLATGLVVDDAIVVMENIYAKIESGISPIRAAFEGSKEVYFAVISTSVTLICVFLPVFFSKGLTGDLFKEFAMVIIGTIVISTFITLSLTPMMCSKILRKSSNPSGLSKWMYNLVSNLEIGFQKSIHAFMKVKYVSFPIIILSFYLMFNIGTSLPKELAPLEDKSKLRVNVIAPEGTSFDAMDRFQVQMMHMLDSIPEKNFLLGITAKNFGSATSVNTSYASVTLVPPSQRTRSQQDIVDWVQNNLNAMTFIRGNVSQDPTISSGLRGGALPIQFVLQAPNVENIKEALPEFLEKVDQSPMFTAANVDLKFSKPEIELQINRNKAMAMGVSVEDISETLQSFLGERRLGYFIKDGKQYFVITELEKSLRKDARDVLNLSLRNKQGQMVSLDNLVETRIVSRPPSLLRYNRYSAATVSAGLATNVTLGQGIDEMNRIAGEVLDESFSTDLAGMSADYRDSNQSSYSIFLFALVLVYLTLAAQFESFKEPLIIMFTIPLALAGALLALSIFNQTLNIFSQIGMIVLIGIVTKNAILIVEFANQKRDQGMPVLQAAKEAASQRFRPIIMTALSTALGALPIAMALGESSTSRIPMGIAIIGGILFSLILTLYVIPALYAYFGQKKAQNQFNEV